MFTEDVPRELAKYENLHGEDVFDANKRMVQDSPRIPCRSVQPAVDDEGHEPDLFDDE